MASPELLLVGHSVRYLAQAAARAGLRVCAVDGFADLDTRAAAAEVRAVAGLDASALVEAACAAAGPETAIVYGAGLEGTPGLLARLAACGDLRGNPAAVIDCIGDPQRFFRLLDDLAIPYPEVRFEAVAAATGWLLKRGGSCGGIGVARLAPDAGEPRLGARRYLQREVSGPVVSALFVANGREARILGFNRVLTTALPGRPFAYAGAIGPISLPAGVRRAITGQVARLTAALALRGVNGIDCVLARATPLLLELNARPPATLELYEPELPAGGLQLHLDGCAGRLPPAPRRVPRTVRGQQVLFALHDTIVADLPWPEWSSDRPPAGTRIAAGEPLCSVRAEARPPARVEAHLAARGAALRGLLEEAREAVA